MMVVAPFAVERTTASITALVPFAKFSNSKTPIGLRKTIKLEKIVIGQNKQKVPVPNDNPGLLYGFPYV